MAHSPGIGPSSSNLYSGNIPEGHYIWTGPMNLCWPALSQPIIREPIAPRTDEVDALEMADRFNHPACNRPHNTLCMDCLHFIALDFAVRHTVLLV